MPHHARAAMWTTEGHRRWFTDCDQCKRWRILGWYYEVYPPRERANDAEGGWWFACADCLVDTISDRLMAQPDEVDEMQAYTLAGDILYALFRQGYMPEIKDFTTREAAKHFIAKELRAHPAQPIDDVALTFLRELDAHIDFNTPLDNMGLAIDNYDGINALFDRVAEYLASPAGAEQ